MFKLFCKKPAIHTLLYSNTTKMLSNQIVLTEKLKMQAWFFNTPVKVKLVKSQCLDKIRSDQWMEDHII